MPLHRQVGSVDLQDQAGVVDRAIFVGQRFRQGHQIGLVAVVMLIEHGRGDDTRRRRRHETFAEAAPHALEPLRRLRLIGALLTYRTSDSAAGAFIARAVCGKRAADCRT